MKSATKEIQGICHRASSPSGNGNDCEWNRGLADRSRQSIEQSRRGTTTDRPEWARQPKFSMPSPVEGINGARRQSYSFSESW
jgi:hypothetical protein